MNNFFLGINTVQKEYKKILEARICILFKIDSNPAFVSFFAFVLSLLIWPVSILGIIFVFIERITINNINKIGIVAIAKNESKYIREWVSFHKAVGFDVIYLYDNDSTDNMLDEISDFIADGFVKVFPISGHAKQLPAYKDAMKRCKHECKYVAVIDCDEFLYPCNNNYNIKQIINEYFKGFGVGAVVVNWLLYGSSGEKEYKDDLVIQRFKYRSNIKIDKDNKHIKSIVNPRVVVHWRNPHSVLLKPGYFPVNEDNIPTWGPFNEKIDIEPKILRINHYFVKSFQEYVERRKLGKADTNPSNLDAFRDNDYFYEKDHNEIYDDSALFYFDKTKAFMKKE